MAKGKILEGFRVGGRRVHTPGLEGHQHETVYRCAGCGQVNTGFSIELFGACWFCGGHRVHGGREGLLWWLLMQLYLDVYFFKALYWWRQRQQGRKTQ